MQCRPEAAKLCRDYQADEEEVMLIKVKRGDTAALKIERDGDSFRFAICAVDKKGLVVEELAHVSIGKGDAKAIIAFLKAPHYEE